MFKLQRLEITGFKSFADYTEIVFTDNGITSIVGPNGCGKSNFSEAVAWVLGEQSAKSLRGSEMQDVIFQGTKKRKPSGMAEVVLHLIRTEEITEESELDEIDQTLGDFDDKAVSLEEIEASAIFEVKKIESADEFPEILIENEATDSDAAIAQVSTKQLSKRRWRPRKLALDFAVGEAVSVTRRLYRSGESEYLLNGKSCRLRDIHDLFSGTGLSGTSYAIVEQGRIGQILSAKPSDRRALIEEAAGISKFRTRQRAAELRLESAKTNLRRISDIVSEIDNRANSLRRQAAKTKRYKILREEFRQLLRQVFSAEGEKLFEILTELQEKLSQASELGENLSLEVLATENIVRQATSKSREAEQFLADLREKSAESALQRDRSLREIDYKRNQTNDLDERLNSLKIEIEATRERLAQVSEDCLRLATEEQEQRKEGEKENSELQIAEQNYQQKSAKLREIEAEAEKLRSELMLHTTVFERLAENKRQLENSLDRLEERAEGLEKEGFRAETELADAAKEIAKAKNEVFAAKEKLETLRTEKSTAAIETNDSRETLKLADKEFYALREKFSRNKHRLETLRELEEKRTVYAPGVQKLFAAQDKIGVTFLGTLADNLKVESKYEKAVETIFGDFLQAVFVSSGEDALKVSNWAAENKIGRICSLIFDEKPKISKKPKASKLQIHDVLGVSDELLQNLSDVLEREINAQIVENLEDAVDSTNEISVTFDGDLLFGGKMIVSGKANVNEKNTSLLAFKRELRELETNFQTLSSEVEKNEKTVDSLRKALAEKENLVSILNTKIQIAEREVFSREMAAKNLAQDFERAERHRKVVVDEKTQISNEQKEVRTRIAKVENDSLNAENSRAFAENALTKISENHVSARTEIENENRILGEKRAEFAASAERRRSISSALRRLEIEQKELEIRLARQSLEQEDFKRRAEELQNSITELQTKIALFDDDKSTEQNYIEDAAQNLKLSREKADDAAKLLAELNQQSAQARNNRAELEVQQAESLTRLQNLHENCVQELSLSLEQLVETTNSDENFDAESGRNRLDDLREKLENFGAVNMLALEELTETEERLLFLTSQRQDIVDGINSAEEALREIKHRSRERFREAFVAINENFREFFFELFGGGQGEMNLIEAEDILDSGIEIVAQPPGKRLQNLLLLSGGEKAMTAIALVLAIFRFRPSPFCLLDEVDAPLDDANISRFVGKVEEMSENTQFIVITHSKRTMEAARALYGVTMEEPGVSKVVSVKFD